MTRIVTGRELHTLTLKQVWRIGDDAISQVARGLGNSLVRTVPATLKSVYNARHLEIWPWDSHESRESIQISFVFGRFRNLHLWDFPDKKTSLVLGIASRNERQRGCAKDIKWT